MRLLSMLIHIHNPHTDAQMIHPYFGEYEVSDAERYEKGQAELAALGPEVIQEALRRGREKYKAAKAARENV